MDFESGKKSAKLVFGKYQFNLISIAVDAKTTVAISIQFRNGYVNWTMYPIQLVIERLYRPLDWQTTQESRINI